MGQRSERSERSACPLARAGLKFPCLCRSRRCRGRHRITWGRADGSGSGGKGGGSEAGAPLGARDVRDGVALRGCFRLRGCPNHGLGFRLRIGEPARSAGGGGSFRWHALSRALAPRGDLRGGLNDAGGPAGNFSGAFRFFFDFVFCAFRGLPRQPPLAAAA